jgi:eukaryotic-like serine/threonine-protein kinase
MDRVLAGRYELEVPLGRGGSGEVWRGRDMATHRPVAIKLVELSLIDDPGLLAETIGRFRREAKVISGLRHPNIVGALDAGRIGNQLFMVMELAPGISLASMMDERGARGMGLFPVSSVLRIAEQVCAGLAAAHAAGIVHRDIKPSNLMVTPSLDIKIIDFGIASLLADNSPRLTLPAHTVGTIAYMSPEQAQGIEVDARADLYSLGCVLYQLLSGRPPFFSTLPGALLMMQVMDRPVPLDTIRPDLPAPVCQLVSDLMEKERTARPADAAQVASRIEAILGTLDQGTPEYEADRETIRASDRPGAGVTWRDDFPPEPTQSAVLTPERMTELSWPHTEAVPSQEPARQVFRSSTPFQAPAPVPAQGPPVRSAPQTATGRGAGTPPEWPVVPPPRRRRSRWPSVLSTLLTVAIIAGVGAYYWIHTHEVLKITGARVSPASERVGCDGTANIIGTITTNGYGGPITYQWVLGDTTENALVVDDASGSDTVRVEIGWTLHGVGTGEAIAKLVVLKPQQTESSIIFPYSCSK